MSFNTSFRSALFNGDAALEACLKSPQGRIAQGATGSHVGKIQVALESLGNRKIAAAEKSAKTYGPSTADAVLDYKTSRKIINYSYQTQPDNIVGQMTIKSLDDEMFFSENTSSMPKVPVIVSPSMPKCGALRVVYKKPLVFALSGSVLGGPLGVFVFQNKLPNDVNITIDVSGKIKFPTATDIVRASGNLSRSFTDSTVPAPIQWDFTITATSTVPVPRIPFIPPGRTTPVPALVEVEFSTNWQTGDPVCVL